MSSKYSIKDLERLSGIKAHTLRIWEQRYNILHPERTDTNIRFYNGNDLRKILNISLLNNNGYKISTIAKLSGAAILTEAEKFLNNYNKESDQIDNLVICLIDVNEELFEKTINNSILKFGFENTFEKIIFPFLKHLGNMWQAGIINPAQEHYISNLIRQKLIVGIDNIKVKINEKAKSYVFFLPNQELHEMGLLYTYYLTKAKGHKCSYLGQSLPLEDLSSIVKTLKPDFLVTIITSSLPENETSEFLRNYSEKIKEPKFLISGRLVLSEKESLQLPPKFKIFEDFEDFKKMI
ncbi:MAG: MerR family transcriptional regulator [Bacteroidota bacterium]|nr:MerR family transcriptional regulator [Bacteroidota bacterium]MDP3146960.1 MerR family transcriptional regulator [Bacteroidota bacterium]